MPPSRFSTHLALLGMSALWGASWPWGRVVAQSMPPLAAAGLRFALASGVLLLWLQRSGRWPGLRQLRPQQWLGLACAALTGVFGYSLFFMLALHSVPAGKASMVVALNPVLTLVAAALLFGERANRAMVAGLLLAVTGALYAIAAGSASTSEALHTWGRGEWLLLGCAACWVGYTLLGRVVLTSVDALTTTTVTAVLGAVLLLTASAVVEGPAAWSQLPQAPMAAWGSLVGLALGATALGYAWYLRGVQVLGAGSAAAYLALVPLFGMLCASLWLGEALTPALLVGGALAMGGMLLMHWGRQRLAATPAP